MSISLVYGPLALLSWAILDKDKFDQWAKAVEIREKLSITDMNQLKDLVVSSEFNFVNYEHFKKTSIGDQYFFWEEKEDGLYLLYTDLTDSNILKSFKKTLELNYGGPVFKGSALKATTQQDKLLPTNFVDHDLLLKVLTDYAVKIISSDNKSIKCEYQSFHFEFIKNENGIFDVKFEDADKLALLHERLVLFDKAYNQNLQNISYQKIKQKLMNQQHEIIEEYVDENDDIVIVVNTQ